MTQFTPPYESGNNPLERPVIVGAGATMEEAASDPTLGLLQIYTEAEVTVIGGGSAAASTGARPYLEHCFLTPRHARARPYTLEFAYAYVFDYELQGGIDFVPIGGVPLPVALRLSSALVEVIAEVRTRGGALPGPPQHDVIRQTATNGGPGIGPAAEINAKITVLTVPLLGNTEYYWRFTFHAAVETAALGLVAKNYAYVNAAPVPLNPAVGGGARHYFQPAPPPGAPVAFRTLLLSSVTIVPNVARCTVPDEGKKLAASKRRRPRGG